MKSLRIAINSIADAHEDLMNIHFQLIVHYRILQSKYESKDKYMRLFEKKRDFFNTITPNFPKYQELEYDLIKAENQVLKYRELEEQLKITTFIMHQINRIQEEFKKEFGSIR